MLRKVVVIGPESTGKSTLSEALSLYFGCLWVPEYARAYLENLDRPYQYEDLLEIARGQVQQENQMAAKSKKLLICDTDLLVVKVWSQHRFGIVDPWIEQKIRVQTCDLYLLTDIDIPWQKDPLREHPSPYMRRYFFEKYYELLSTTQIPFFVVSGNESDRLTAAINQVQQLFKK